MQAKLLFLAVQYNNSQEVRGFVEQIGHLKGTDQMRISVCDNSESFTALGNAVDTMTHRPDNPGYLDGAIQALDSYLEQGHPVPNWVCITNTDIDFADGQVLPVLEALDPSARLVVAPRITEGTSRTEKNPHVISPRSNRRLRLNHTLTSTPVRAMGFLTISAIWTWLRRLARNTRTTVPSGGAVGTMYSPYGAQMYFSRAFIQEVGLPTGVPLLAEEWAIAEAAKNSDSLVQFTPDIWIHHDPHKTTGPKLTWRRARMLSRAFAYIGDSTRDE